MVAPVVVLCEPEPTGLIPGPCAVIGAKGTLPPKGDQANIPEWGRGFVDVVGDPSELAALLTAIAVPYVERYPR